jgi:hypothetical protein
MSHPETPDPAHRQPSEEGTDAFEQHLARQPLSPPPAALRARILAGAVRASASDRRPRSDRGQALAWWEALILRVPLMPTLAGACLLMVWLGTATDRWANGQWAVRPAEVSREVLIEIQAQRVALQEAVGGDGPNSGRVLREPSQLRPRSGRSPAGEPGWGILPSRRRGRDFDWAGRRAFAGESRA